MLDGRVRNQRGNSRRWIMLGSRTPFAAWARTTSTSTRSTAPTRPTDFEETLGALTDLVRAGRSVHRLVDLPGEQIVRRNGRRATGLTRFLHRAAAVLDPRSRDRRPRCSPTRARNGMGVSSGGPLSAAGSRARLRKDQSCPDSRARSAAARAPTSDQFGQPAPAVEIADQLGRPADEAGLPLIQIALGLRPAHTSPALDRRRSSGRDDGAPREPAPRGRDRARRRCCWTASTSCSPARSPGRWRRKKPAAPRSRLDGGAERRRARRSTSRRRTGRRRVPRAARRRRVHPAVLLMMDAYGLRPRSRDGRPDRGRGVPSCWRRTFSTAPARAGGLARRHRRPRPARGGVRAGHAAGRGLTPEQICATAARTSDAALGDGPVAITGYCMGGRSAGASPPPTRSASPRSAASTSAAW